MEQKEDTFIYKDLNLAAMYLIEEISKLSHTITASENSMRAIQELPALFDDINKLAGNTDKQYPNLEKTVKVIKREIDNEFIFLHTQFALMLYSYLEAAIKKIIISFLKANQGVDIKEFSDIQIKLYEYLKLDESEKYEYLYQQYEKKNAVGLVYGLTRFEKLLAPLKLNGETPDLLSRDIFELSQVRNIIIHNGGIADRHFIKHCPWLNCKMGQKLVVTKSLTQKYFNSVSNYATILSIRITNAETPNTIPKDILEKVLIK